MTATGPYSEATDFKHMRHIQDIRGDLPHKQYNPNSIYGILKNTPYLSVVSNLVEKAGLEKHMDKDGANFTLIAAKDGTFRMPKGRGNILRTVNVNTLSRRIPLELLVKNRTSVYPTKDQYTNISAKKTDQGIILNEQSQLTGYYIEADNGLILVAKGLCQPTNLC